MTDYAHPLLIPFHGSYPPESKPSFWATFMALQDLVPAPSSALSGPLLPSTGPSNRTEPHKGLRIGHVLSHLQVFACCPSPLNFTQLTLVILWHQLRICTLTSLCPLSPGWARGLSGLLCLSACLCIPVPPTTWLTPLYTKHFLRALATVNSYLYPQCPDHAGHTERVREEMNDNDDSKSPKRPIFIPSFSYL